MLKKYMIMLACGWVLGCATADPARYIMRKCPVKRVYGDEASLAVIRLRDWQGGKVKVIGECVHDSVAIKMWAEANGIPCTVESVQNGNHWTVAPAGSKYWIDYVDGIGLVKGCK